MSSTQSKEADSQGLDKPLFLKTFAKLTEDLPERSRIILQARFGMTGSAPQTLEAIGTTYDITRERVRQIIRASVLDINRKKYAPLITAVEERVLWTLGNHSDIMRDKTFYRALADQDANERGAARFFVEQLLPVQTLKGSSERFRATATAEFSLKRWHAIVALVKSFIETGGKPVTEAELLSFYQHNGQPSLTPKSLLQYLTLAKEVRKNVYGLWGLSHWSDIRPKGARSKAYLVLKMHGTPLHFRAIASLIDAKHLQKKGHATHPQTVHNELIKDARFVLVGRGMYALAEWGYKRGTVREVIADILKESRAPLNREAILERMARYRTVKKSTVIINLNAHFRKVDKNAYTLKDQPKTK